MVLRILKMMKQQNCGKFASIGAMTLLGFNLVVPQNAQAITYDVDFSVNSFSATGTLETSGTGDLANGDFTFTDWEVFLDDGSGGAPEATLTPADNVITNLQHQPTNFSTGDVVATNSTLSFSNLGNNREAFAMFDSGFRNGLCFGFCFFTQLETGIRIANVNQIDSTGASGTNFAVFDAASASVPFEFSPTLGLLAVGSLFGISRLRKSTKSFKLK
jgi:hypothetical protein